MQPIENYALLSDCHSAALVGKNGSIDWLGFPCFDSSACFAALLGSKDNGRWSISPKGEYSSSRKYVDDTVVLETTFSTKDGKCKITDCMLMEDEFPTIARIVEGIEGTVQLELELIIRFDYGSIIPWVRRNQEGNGIHAVAGPEGLVLYSPVKLQGKNLQTTSEFKIGAGEKKTFTLISYQSHKSIPKPIKDICEKVDQTIGFWREWVGKCKYNGFDKDSVKRSFLTLKALTYKPTGAIVAAPTTSLPEEIGGSRNWDYRYGWIRDSSFTLYALLKGGYKNEAIEWREWLLRAAAGTPSQLNLIYGIRGERRLTEIVLEWLDGYEGSRPVRIGNAAYKQFQLDVFGELMRTSYLGRINGIPINDNTWRIEKQIIRYVSKHWKDPDEGIWEVRGARRHFVHSKLMAWVAMDSAIRTVEEFDLDGDIESWKETRDEIHQEICEKGFNKRLNSFIQSYESDELDASVLMMFHVKFLPVDDPRMVGTVEAIMKHLRIDGYVLRYHTESKVDGLPGHEGSFIACSFWLVDALRMMGRREEALQLYRHVKSVKNDLGLYAEEYMPDKKRMVGNFPQAFSHIAEAISAMGFEDS